MVDMLLDAGAKSSGNSKHDNNSEVICYFPPIALCLKKKLRDSLIQELTGIKYHQVADKHKDVDLEECLSRLLYNGADPNQSLFFVTPTKPLPIFHALKNLQAV